jgi:hypothetical protein
VIVLNNEGQEKDDRYSSWKDERLLSKQTRRWQSRFQVDPKDFLLSPRGNPALNTLESMLMAVYFAGVFMAFDLPRNPGGIAGLFFSFFLTSFANHSALLRYGLAIAGVAFPVLCSIFAKDFVANEWTVPLAAVLIQIVALVGFSRFKKWGTKK